MSSPKKPQNTASLDLGGAIKPGDTITYRSGMSGVVLTVNARGDMPIYTQDQEGRVIAHRATGRVNDRVEGAYDIIPLRKTLDIRVALVQGADGIAHVKCALGHGPVLEPEYRVLKLWELTHELD